MPFAISILHSKQFTFLIGVDETPITVHSGAIAALSAPLDRLVNGDFMEAQNNRARFQDIEVVDFEKICAVAYGAELPAPETSTLPASTVDIKEDFWVLSPRIIGPESLTLRDNRLVPHVLCATIGDLNHLPDIPARSGPKALYENTFTEYHYCKLLDVPDEDEAQSLGLPALYGESGGSTATRSSSWNQDVSGVLQSYARIYMFSEEFLVAKLQEDAEAALRDFLARLDVYPPTRAAIIELI